MPSKCWKKVQRKICFEWKMKATLYWAREYRSVDCISLRAAILSPHRIIILIIREPNLKDDPGVMCLKWIVFQFFLHQLRHPKPWAKAFLESCNLQMPTLYFSHKKFSILSTTLLIQKLVIILPKLSIFPYIDGHITHRVTELSWNSLGGVSRCIS